MSAQSSTALKGVSIPLLIAFLIERMRFRQAQELGPGHTLVMAELGLEPTSVS
jgi:hypothetical protein